MRLTYLAAALVALTLSPALRAQNLVACQGGTAMGFACDGVDLYARMAPSTFGASGGNDIWGWTDPDTGREYALVGLTNGTAFVDVTEPETPVYLGILPTATSNSSWRDVKTYADHAFIVSEASNHGMQVFDLTRLRDVQSPPETFTADARFTRFGNAHNIAIDEESGFAYPIGTGSQCGGGLYIVDIRDPLNPVEAGCFYDGYTHDAQCLVYTGPDEDYQGRQVCAAFNEDHVAFVDVTDKANPALISQGFYPNPGYTHQGWFTEDFRHLLIDDEVDDFVSATTRTIVMNVEDLDAPEFDFFYYGPLAVTDHNLYVRGQYAYLSNYEGGLRILDLAGLDDGTLVEVGSFDTYPTSNNETYNGQWSNYPYFESGTLIANDQNFGLFVLRPGVLATAGEPTPEVPDGAGYVLTAPVPNPSRAGASLQLSVVRTQDVRAEVLDVAGRRVALLHDGPVAAGAAVTLRLDGAALPAGLYLVRVVGEDFTATQRASLVR